MRKFKFDRGFVATTSPDPIQRLDDMYLALFVRVESVARSICAPTKFDRLIEKARSDEATNLEWRKIGRIHNQVLDEMEDRAPVGYHWTQWQKDGITYYGYAPLEEEDSPPIAVTKKVVPIKQKEPSKEPGIDEQIVRLKEFAKTLELLHQFAEELRAKRQRERVAA